MKKIKYSKILKVSIIIFSILLASFFVLYSMNNAKIKEEVKTVEKIDDIWDNAIESIIKWEEGELNREQIAVIGNELLAELNQLKEIKDYSDYKIDIIENIFSNTNVMLFDMIRGYDLENNPYVDMPKYEDETLSYVYPKRNKSFKRMIQYVEDKYINKNKNSDEDYLETFVK